MALRISLLIFILGCSLISGLVIPKSKFSFSKRSTYAALSTHGTVSEWSTVPSRPRSMNLHSSSKISNSNYIQKNRSVFQAIAMKIVLGLLSFFVGLPVSRVFAATSRSYPIPKINGWDLYGRVPYDDSMFSSWFLTDPNILKRSIVEEVKRFLLR